MAVVAACALVLAVGLVALWASARAAITIAVLRVEDGKLTVTRGGLAPRVLADLRDVVARPKVVSATVRVVRAKDRARVEVSGQVSDQHMQRLRNVIGTVPMAQLVNARRR
jgi:hypothetical protein